MKVCVRGGENGKEKWEQRVSMAAGGVFMVVFVTCFLQLFFFSLSSLKLFIRTFLPDLCWKTSNSIPFCQNHIIVCQYCTSPATDLASMGEGYTSQMLSNNAWCLPYSMNILH